MAKKRTTKRTAKRVTKSKKEPKKNADIRYREYWRDNERFADLFNTVVFGGEPVLNPSELKESDTRVSRLIPMPEFERGIERTRDIMKSHNGTKYLLLGVESQSHIHYGIPLKSLTYDVLGYIDEAKQISDRRKLEKGLTSAEFLSGMRKEDRLTPIITIVIYYGEEPWDGPLSLTEMFDENMRNNGWNQTEHRVILLQVNESDHYHFQNKDNETVFSISRELFRGNMEQVKEQYNTLDLSQELIAMIGCITGIKGMEQVAQEGEKNMCKAMDALFEQERIKTEERMCKSMQAAFDKERRKTEERMIKRMQDALDKERRKTEEQMTQRMQDALDKELRVIEENSIHKLVSILGNLKVNNNEIRKQLMDNYNLTEKEVKLYL